MALAQLQVLQYGAVGVVQELQDIANETLIDDSDKGRLTHRGAIRAALQRRIEQCVASVIDSVGDVEEARRAAGAVVPSLSCRALPWLSGLYQVLQNGCLGKGSRDEV